MGGVVVERKSGVFGGTLSGAFSRGGDEAEGRGGGGCALSSFPYD